MEQQSGSGMSGMGRDDTPGTAGTPGMGGAANTPSFGAGEPASVATAADHQIPADTDQGTGSQQMKDRMSEAREKAETRVNQGMRQAADRLDDLASRLDTVADQRLGTATGTKARAGELAHGVADTMESVSSYLRSNDMSGLQRDLERQVRERPLQTLLMGVAAGWVVGKILR